MLIINEIPPPENSGGVFRALIVKCTALFSVCCYCKYSEFFYKSQKVGKTNMATRKGSHIHCCRICLLDAEF